MTPQEYVTALSFFAFTMLMTGGIALAIFWPAKKSRQKQKTAAPRPETVPMEAAPADPVAPAVVSVANTEAA